MLAFKFNRFDRGHANVFQTFQMSQIALAEGHKETNPLDTFNVESQRFKFFMMQKVHIFFADLRKIIDSFDFHRFCLYPIAIFPVAAFSSNFADIDFRIEVSGERIAMVAGIGIEDVNVINFIEIVFLCIGRENSCYARVKATAQKRGNTGFFKTLAIIPLPLVFKLSCIKRFVVCSINIRRLRSQAGIHNCKVLIRKCQIKHYIRLKLVNQCNSLINVISIQLSSMDFGLAAIQFSFQRIAFTFCSAGNHNFFKYFTVLAALVNCHTCNAAATYN